MGQVLVGSRPQSYCPDPDTMRPVRDSVGEWTNPLPPPQTTGNEARQILRLVRRRAAEEGFDPAEVGAGPEADEDDQRGK